MITNTSALRSTTALRIALATVVVSMAAGCNAPEDKGTKRWVTTENVNVAIDWDQVGKAYREAAGPEDFERRVNEIYTGSETISVSVQDADNETQVVTGFFDKDNSGAVSDSEKIFTIKRSITGESGNYQVQGHGYYGGYRSPMWDIASGMLLGSMISRAFMPGYQPMYRQPYTTSASRRSALRSGRTASRSARSGSVRKTKSSKTGRSYGSQGRSPARRSSRSRVGGGRFGLRRRDMRRRRRRVLLAD